MANGYDYYPGKFLNVVAKKQTLENLEENKGI